MLRLGHLHSHLANAAASTVHAADGTSPPPPLTADEADAIERYDGQGTIAALSLGNRGPLRLEDGRLADDIVESYLHHGFYVFTGGVLEQHELTSLQEEFATLLSRAPEREGSVLAADGEPAFEPDWWSWADALGDPTGGKGRAVSRMRRHPVPAGSPARVISGTTSHLQKWEPGLRLYAHPKLLAVAATIHGEDFCRFNEGLQIKMPRVGPSLAWYFIQLHTTISIEILSKNDGWTLKNDGWTLKNDGWALKHDGWALKNDGWTLKNDDFVLIFH